MFFLVLAADRPGKLRDRLDHRPRHLDYWSGHAGALKLAGAMLEGDRPIGSAFLLEAEDETAVRALIAADPFAIEAIFEDDIRIQPFRPAIGEWKPD